MARNNTWFAYGGPEEGGSYYIQWNMVDHDRGTGCWKLVFPDGACAPIKPAALRGAWAWLKRGDKRQVTMNLVNGTVWCEQQ